MNPALHETLASYVGRGGDTVTAATDPVTAEAIRQVVNVTGDLNPLYRDPACAVAAAVHGGLVAPPSSVLWWHRGHFEPIDSSEGRGTDGARRYRLDPNPVRQEGMAQTEHGVLADVMRLLAANGHDSIVVTNAEVTLDRYPRVGDRLSCVGPVIESIVGPKATALGEGYFSTSVYRLLDQAGAQVAHWRTTRLHFAPRARAASAASTAAQPVKATSRALCTQPVASGAAEGTDLPERLAPWVVEVTPTLVIAGALATRDAQDVHHDGALARRRGFKNIFLNNFTTMALVSRFVTDWAGPGAAIRSFSFRLGRPQYPHDLLRFTGAVTRRELGDDGLTRLEVEVLGDNALGNHVRCALRLELHA